MNSAHDVGGMDNFASLGQIDPTDPIFHGQWEKRMMAINVAMGATGQWNIDMIRAARESMPPAQYLNSSYFEIWYYGLCKVAIEKGLVTQDELDSARLHEKPLPVAKVLEPDQVQAVLLKGSPTNRPLASVPLFAVGQTVQTRLMNPKTHTRLPRYARGRVGVITAHHGGHVYPDDSALGVSRVHHLYTVTFEAAALWGADSTASRVSVDCWEPYLEHQ
jgi:nitrile hydratase subunit beta